MCYPLSRSGCDTGVEKSEGRVKDALRVKAKLYRPKPFGLKNMPSSYDVDVSTESEPLAPIRFWCMRRNSDGSFVGSEQPLVGKGYAEV